MRDIVDHCGFPAWSPKSTARWPATPTPATTRIAHQWTVENSVCVDAAFRARRRHQPAAGLIDTCVARGYRQMVAVIGEPTNTASIKLHERFGFELVGVPWPRPQAWPLAGHRADAARGSWRRNRTFQ